MNKLSRRRFLKLSGKYAAGITVAGTAISASGCAPAAQPIPENSPASPTSTTVEKAAPAATPTTLKEQAATATIPAPTEASRTYYRPEVIKFHPTQKSRVVRAREAAVWKEDKLDAALVRGMVDRSITNLTGVEDVRAAWQALFKPEERIVIKVNVFRNSLIWTHLALVTAVTDSLQEAGIPPEQITIYDYYTRELETAGYPVNKDGPGVRCYGTDSAYSTIAQVGSASARLSDILTQADALINIPVLKSHMIAGLTFALKNHFGSVENPAGLHNIRGCLGALNALPPIKDATRLVIGDALAANTKYKNSFPYWDEDAKGDSILMSFDPLAADRVALDLLVKMAEEKGNSTTGILGMCEQWLDQCSAAGIGTCDLEQVELVEI